VDPVPAHDQEAAPRRYGRAWRDAPLRVKMTTLLVTAAVVGSALGIVAAFYRGHYGVWIWTLGLTGLMIALERTAALWVWRPYQQLLQIVERVIEADCRDDLDELRLSRRDEVGRLANYLHELASGSIRHRRNAELVRRRIDARIADATRKATRKLHDIAMRDGLTDLGNRRFLDQTLEPLVQSIHAANSELICMAIDIDHFKQVNDTLGHAAGDELLILLGSLIRASIRHSDYAIRPGGDEFVVLMPGCSVTSAKRVAERIGELFGHHTRTTLPGHLGATVSIGIAALEQAPQATGAELLEAADQNLYAAKRAGKARTVAAGSLDTD
jgi:diguanylate cyclase (GGDEF)-like protein